MIFESCILANLSNSGRARASPVLPRADAGCRRHAHQSKGPINQWLKNRRRQIHKAVTTSPQPVTELAPAAEVPDGARRERRFQRTRLMERRIEALRSGTLLGHEAADPELLRESDAYEKREHTHLADTLRAARRRDGASQSRAFDVGLAGCTVFTRCTGPPI